MSQHITETHVSVAERPGLVARLVAWWLAGPPGHEIERLGAAEVERMAHDLGLRPDELRQLAQRDSDAELLLHRRLDLLGVSLADAERLGLRRDLERTCGLCREQNTCVHDLEMRPDSEDWKSYCPNCGVLETLAAEVKKPADDGDCCKR